MSKNTFFRFKQFTIHQDKCAMKVSTDACLFGAWVSLLETDKNALDIGCGTGLLSCMIAQKQQGIFIDSIEIDEQAFTQAKNNLSESPFSKQVAIHHTSLQDYQTNAEYDLIFSNPPYFEQDLPSPDQFTNIAKHSTELTLETLFFHAQKLLKNSGRFCLVIPSKRWNDVIALAEKFGMRISKKVEIHHAPNKPCNLLLIEILNQKCTMQTAVFFIKDQNGNDSDQMKKLLQDYYLNF
jgi:tRNA1Val (adenine37-N6)-methyltransferase